jgi:hypothetical protein
MLNITYENKASTWKCVTEGFKASEGGMRAFEMTQRVGSCQILEIKEQMQKFKNGGQRLSNNHKIDGRHELGNSSDCP